MRLNDPRIADWIRRHDGVIDRHTLVQLGVNARSVDGLVDRGDLRVLFPGIFVSTHVQVGPRQLMQAACRRNEAAALGFTTAGQLWGIRKMRDPRIHVLVPHGSSPRLDGVVVHRCRDVVEADVTELERGLRATTPARTLFDASAIIGVDRTESALEHALDLGLVTVPEIVSLCERLAKRGRPGTRQMRQVLAGRPLFQSAVQSDLEHRVLKTLRRLRIAAPITQYRLELPDGRWIRFDFAWPRQRVALEVDHPFWHGGREAQHRDKERDRKAIALGWRVLRITDWDVESDLRSVVDDLRAALRHS